MDRRAVPALNETNVRHLLRRTEFVDRRTRVEELLSLSSLEEAVDDVLAVPANPPVASPTASSDWHRSQQLIHFWLDRMAHDAERPFQERMAFFWHGHLCSNLGKIGSADRLQDQIDLYRRDGLGNVCRLVTAMSIQVAMLRYLDNNRNRRTSPNQNFARELLELFLLGVGNYTEADVEAATAAWTGHTDDWQTDEYVWRGPPRYVNEWENWHDNSDKHFLGRTINLDKSDHAQRYVHAFETIDVVLGDPATVGGTVPSDAPDAANRGRPTRDVAAEFLSRKLWEEFANTDPLSFAVARDDLRDALVGNDFDVRPWVRALLVHDEFYSERSRAGLVRQPVEYVVALLAATGLRSEVGASTWLMERAGQVPLSPPNVSGWRPNGYWVNPSAMEARNRMATGCAWRLQEHWWTHPWQQRHLNYLQFGGGDDPAMRIYQNEVFGDDTTVPMSPAELVDRMLELLDLRLDPAARTTIVDFTESIAVHHRADALSMIFIDSDLHLA